MGEGNILLPADLESDTGVSHSKCLGHHYQCHQTGTHASTCYLAPMANAAFAKKLLAWEPPMPIEVGLETSSTSFPTLSARPSRDQRPRQPPTAVRPSPNQTLGTARAH